MIAGHTRNTRGKVSDALSIPSFGPLTRLRQASGGLEGSPGGVGVERWVPTVRGRGATPAAASR